MEYPIRVVQYGLGPIGLACVQALLARQDSGKVQLVGAIDTNPDLIGEDLGTLVGHSSPLGIKVSNDAQGVLSRTRPHIALLTTSSFLDRIYDQIEICADAGVSIVSSSEELFFPFVRHAEAAERIDKLAHRTGVAVFATGVNPGFVMDTLVLSATSMCTEVRTVRARRVVDAAHRRLPLQRKIGAGLTPEAFQEKKETGTFGHIGLLESLHFVARGLGWQLDRVDEQLEAVLADREVVTPYLQVQPGRVAGIHHQAHGYQNDRIVLSLDLQMYVGAGDSYDAIQIDGVPPVEVRIPGGIFGDTATVAALINAIPLIAAANPGLHTTADLPLPRAFIP